jgi:glucokinase
MDSVSDQRIVMTLDAGGSSFRFSAVRANAPVVEPVTTPSHGDDLDRCLATLRAGFAQVRSRCPAPPVAISFAFPGPADYPAGIIGDLGNLPAFRGGVALGPMLQFEFGIPVFINNDGQLFAYGEAIAGFLPYVNGLLHGAGSPKRYRTLFGVTLGTGLGGGITRNGEMFGGDNSNAAQIWLVRNKLDPTTNAEEGASIRAVRRVYAERGGIALDRAPEPRIIADIALGRADGNRDAAVAAYRQLGEAVGDAMGNALTLIDGLAVIGGGVAGAWPLFLPSLMAELNGQYRQPRGTAIRRLPTVAFNLENPEELKTFLAGETRTITVPGSGRTIAYDPLQRIGVGMARLDTSRAVAIGAYAFALRQLDAG